jgi:hypothetical protein
VFSDATCLYADHRAIAVVQNCSLVTELRAGQSTSGRPKIDSRGPGFQRCALVSDRAHVSASQSCRALAAFIARCAILCRFRWEMLFATAPDAVLCLCQVITPQGNVLQHPHLTWVNACM